MDDSRTAESLLPLVCQELRRLASSKTAQEHLGQTLQATALIHEAWLSVQGRKWNGPFVPQITHE